MTIQIQKINKKQILKQVIFRSKKRSNQIYEISHNTKITHTQKKWLQLVTIFRIYKVQERINEILKNNITKNTTKLSIWKEGEPIVDIELTKQIVAVKTKFEDKKICRADEIVYLTRNKRGYRKEGKFYGTSPLEPILTISKSIKRIYNYESLKP